MVYILYFLFTEIHLDSCKGEENEEEPEELPENESEQEVKEEPEQEGGKKEN